jgi:hypothetical protein
MQNLFVFKETRKRTLTLWQLFSDIPSHPKLLSWGVVLQFSESGPLQSVKVLQDMFSNTTQHPSLPTTRFIHNHRGEACEQSWKTETTFHDCWRVKSSFKLVWMEPTFSNKSLIGNSLKWLRCSLVWPKSLRQNPILTTRLHVIESSLMMRGPWSECR